MNRLYIVAGNAKQATAWAAEGHIHKDNYVIINHARQLEQPNVSDAIVAFVGTYYSRTDIHEIRQILDRIYLTK